MMKNYTGDRGFGKPSKNRGMSTSGKKMFVVSSVCFSIIVSILVAGCIGGDDSQENTTPPVQDRNPLMPAGPMPEAFLNIKGYGLNLNFSFKELANRTDLINNTFCMKNELGVWSNSTYVGVSLFNLVGNFSPPIDGGLVKFTAEDDGYSKTVAWPLLKKYKDGGNDTVIALAMNGSFITGNKGPMRLVCSSLMGAYWVGNLTRIEFIPWELKIILPSFTPVFYNISQLKQMETTTTNYTNPKNGTVTPYTGVNLTTLISAAGLTLNSSHSLTFKGMDDYEVKLNWSDIENAYLESGNSSVIAYQSNGTALTWEDKGPIMVVIPGMASQKQVKNLVSIQIEVIA